MVWQLQFQYLTVNIETLENLLKIFYWILVAIIGLCVGSFLNVIIYRLPRKINLAKPRSFCPNCDHKLAWYDNIPVFAYIGLGGKCRYCRKKITPRYMIVELLTMGMWLWTYALFGQYNLPICILSFIVISALIAIAFIDAELYIIPDSLNLLILICGVIATACQFNIKYINGPVSVGQVDWVERLIGFGAVIVIFLIVSLIEAIIKKEIIGGGDIKLFGAISLLLGWRLLALGIFFGAILALVIGFPVAKLTDKEGSEGGKILPFGPFLAMGFIISLFYGLPLISLYLGLAM